MKNLYRIILISGMIIILILLFLSIKKARENERLLYEVEFYTDSLNRYTKVYNSESFSKLKKKTKNYTTD